MRRINLGCGSILRDGWLNLDVDRVPEADGRRDFLRYDARDGLPFDDGTQDLIVANHMLCQLTAHEVPPLLAECRRVLAPGGALRVLVPDLLGAVAAWKRRDRGWFPNLVEHEGRSIDEGLCSYVTWFGTNRSVYTPELLVELLLRAGFTGARVGATAHVPSRVEGGDELDDRERESLVAEGIVPERPTRTLVGTTVSPATAEAHADLAAVLDGPPPLSEHPSFPSARERARSRRAR